MIYLILIRSRMVQAATVRKATHANSGPAVRLEPAPAPVDLGAAATFSVLADTSVVSPRISTVGGDHGVAVDGRSLHAGVHETAVAFSLAGVLTLDREGDPTPFHVHVRAAVTTAAKRTVVFNPVIPVDVALAPHWDRPSSPEIGAFGANSQHASIRTTRSRYRGLFVVWAVRLLGQI
jgi:hypothetical protein